MEHTQRTQTTQPAVLGQKLLYRMPDLTAAIGLSKGDIYRRIKAGTFPKGVRISKQVVVWNPEEIRLWVEKQLVPSDVP
ncbi:helix-turn-helix transcriptional regulator [Bordetella avium]|uniref:helix-turn-helix transcriptional regulator n=2 Tax=Bordetella avium TaxID=521 RepID=UPI0009DCD746|nr:AlpA family phage regulatory protein [Bordetella avium]